MEMNDFLKNFIEQFDDIDTSDFTPETDFRDNDEWSSLTALSVIAMADEVYNVKLTGDDIKKAIFIKDLYEIIKAKKG